MNRQTGYGTLVGLGIIVIVFVSTGIFLGAFAVSSFDTSLAQPSPKAN